MTRIGVRAVVLSACLAAAGCTTYNPATGTYETDPVGTSVVAGGLGLAGGVALGAALADDNDCCWGGGWGGYRGGQVDVHNHYNRTVNYNKNVDRHRTKVRTGDHGGGGYRAGGGGGRRAGGGGGGRRGGGGGRRR